jgi:phage tail tape-measure protein
VGVTVGERVGETLISVVGSAVGSTVNSRVGVAVGSTVGSSVGLIVGETMEFAAKQVVCSDFEPTCTHSSPLLISSLAKVNDGLQSVPKCRRVLREVQFYE